MKPIDLDHMTDMPQDGEWFVGSGASRMALESHELPATGGDYPSRSEVEVAVFEQRVLDATRSLGLPGCRLDPDVPVAWQLDRDHNIGYTPIEGEQ